MGRIPDEIIHEIRDRIDLVDLLGRYLSLRPSGKSFKGLCPFHDEKTPSFHVHRERQSYYCFGCGAHGDCFRFLTERENLSFPEAVRQLAAEVGVVVPENQGGESGVTEQLVRANDLAQALFRQTLDAPEGEAARKYLSQRGLDAAAIERFGIGCAPDGWDGLRRALLAQQIPESAGQRAGLLAERRSGGTYDLLRARVTFPVHDVRGRVIGFGGRATRSDQEPKYLNTPETPLFRKRESLYALHHALEPMRSRGRAVVAEGYFDAIALHRAGVGEAVATCGTALGEAHARQLRRRTSHVVLLFDGDEAGERAMERALGVLLPEGLRVLAAALPQGRDPDDLLREEGAEALRARVDAAPPAIERVMRRAVAQGCGTAWEKADAVNAVVPILALVPDRVERHEQARQLALRVGTEVAHVEAALARGRQGRVQAESLPVQLPRREPQEERHLRRLAQVLVEHPQLAPVLPPQELLALIEGSEWAGLIAALLEAGPERSGQVSELAEQLPDELAASLRRLAAGDDSGCDEEAGRRVLVDTLAWFRRRQQKSERSDATRRLQSADGEDTASLLEAKARQLAERRARFDSESETILQK